MIDLLKDLGRLRCNAKAVTAMAWRTEGKKRASRRARPTRRDQSISIVTLKLTCGPKLPPYVKSSRFIGESPAKVVDLSPGY